MFSLAQFYKLPSVIQIFYAEFIMTLCLGGLSQHAWRRIHPQKLSYVPPAMGLSDFVFSAIGFALLAYLLYGIFYPRVGPVSWTPVFHTQKMEAIAAMPGASVEYAFLSNHPSYVFIDLIVVAFWLFMRTALKIDPERLYEGNLWVAVALFVPACRLVCWYILRRRPTISADIPSIRDAWMPVAQLYLFFIAPLALVLLIAVIRDS